MGSSRESDLEAQRDLMTRLPWGSGGDGGEAGGSCLKSYPWCKHLLFSHSNLSNSANSWTAAPDITINPTTEMSHLRPENYQGESTAPPLNRDNWIKALLSKALPSRTNTQFFPPPVLSIRKLTQASWGPPSEGRQKKQESQSHSN